MGKNFAIECEGQTDYVPGEPWNKTESEAELAWREVQKLYFVPVTVRRTTDDEDAKLGNPIECVNSIGKMPK